MKRIFTLIFSITAGISAMMGAVTVGTTTYQVDTISQRQIGPGLVNTILRLPDFPLNVYILEMDLNNQYNRVETTQAYDILGKQETLANAYQRHKAEGKKPLAGCNANFWCVQGHGEPWISFMLGTPFGGVVYNDTTYVNTNEALDTWNGGPYRTASAAIDHNKVLYMGRKMWRGFAKNPKFVADRQFMQINKRCLDGEMAIFTKQFGTTRVMQVPDGSTFVYMSLKDGESWGVNKDTKLVVKEIKAATSGLTLGSYDLCLVGHGDANIADLAKLVAGDEVTINHGWATIDEENNVSPFIENLVEGNAPVMHKGELTERNEDEGYNSMVYSRTMYGSSADGKILYMVCADKSTGQYGLSAGCTTAQLCTMLKQWCPAVSEIVNFDAGGSAQMLVGGNIINKTTEGTPRAVACGWMLYSIAPGTDTNVASIQFEKPHVKMPIFTTYTPKILGYNQYGELVNEDVQGVVFSANNDVITASGSVITAGSKPGFGLVSATYNGYTISKTVEVVESNLAIRIKPTILIDAKREYPMEVSSTLNGESFLCNPAAMNWGVDNTAVANITNGVLKGATEGTTAINCSYKSFSDATNVKVEIAPTPVMAQSWADWTLKGTGFSNLALSSAGKLSFNYAYSRGANCTITKDITFYSLPDKIVLDFVSDIPLQYIQVDMRSNTMTSANYLTYGKNDGGFEAGKRYELELKISDLGLPTDLILYPISLKNIKFMPPTSGITSGAYNITMNSLYAQYSSYSGTESIIADGTSSIKVYPNPVTDGVLNVCASGVENAKVDIFNQAGVLVVSKELPGATSTIDMSDLAKGLYLVKVVTAIDSKVSKIVVK